MARGLLVLGLVVFVLVCVGLMWLGYRHRRQRQTATLPPLPAVPAEFEGTERLEPLDGVYVSTTTTESWQDRVAFGDVGFRSRVTVHLYPSGVFMDRQGARALWIPAEAVVDVRMAKGLAGKVMGTASLLVMRWRVEDTEFDTGVLADEPARSREWLTALETVTGGSL